MVTLGEFDRDPGILDVVVDKSPDAVCIYLTPDANCLLFIAGHCLCSSSYVNVTTVDYQNHLEYLDAATTHRTKGVEVSY